MFALYLDLINKVVVPQLRQLAADIENYKKQQQEHLREQQRSAREIEFHKQRIKENKNVTGR